VLEGLEEEYSEAIKTPNTCDVMIDVTVVQSPI